MSAELFCRVPTNWLTDPSLCFFEWQGLAGGILAVRAAGLGVYFLRRQIDQSDRHERERLQRQQNAVRATLPLTLSGLIGSLTKMLLALHAAKADVRDGGFTSDFGLLATPTEHIAELQAVIGSTDIPTVAEPIAHIIREIQTLWARVEILSDEREQQSRAGLLRNIDEWIIQSAQIHALVGSLFSYARAEAATGPSSVAWERAEAAIFHLRIESGSLVELIKHGLETSPNFWTLNDR